MIFLVITIAVLSVTVPNYRTLLLGILQRISFATVIIIIIIVIVSHFRS